MVAAVAYYRMSTDKQDTSIADQTAEVEQLAKDRGYDIIRVYPDEGISGDDTKKRLQFRRMIRDAEEKGDFEVILCWDQDRFGRFDSLEAGFWITPLREAGVRLETVAQGTIDWNDFAGRMMYGIQQEGKHQFLRDLSRNITRSKKQIAEGGDMASGAIPYAYNKEFRDASGNVAALVQRTGGDRILKQRGWNARLVVNRVEAAIVVRIFRQYADTDVGLRALMIELNCEGIPSPRGKKWSFSSVRNILTNPVYTGDYVYGRCQTGKYHYIAKDGIKTTGRIPSGRAKRIAKTEDQWIILPDHHEAIIDRDTFEYVQQKLAARVDRSTPRRDHSDRYFLSGMLYCHHCGKPMYAHFDSQQEKTVYVCSTYTIFGKPAGCPCYRIHQEPLVAFLVSALKEVLFSGGRFDELRAAVRSRLQRRRKSAPEKVDALETEIGKLDKTIDRAADRLLTAPDEITDVLAPKIAAWRRERTSLQKQRRRAERETKPVDIETEVETTVERARHLSEELTAAKPARLRELLRRFAPRIELEWEENRGREECRRRKGPIFLLKRADVSLGATDLTGDLHSLGVAQQ